jgi:hypothetical protein
MGKCLECSVSEMGEEDAPASEDHKSMHRYAENRDAKQIKHNDIIINK